MTEVYITAATRTGVGSFNGSLASLPAHDLGKIVINETIKKAGIDQSEVTGFYAYGIYIPEDKTQAEDFWFGNFHENLESMNLGNELWEATGGEAKALLESVSTCEVSEVSNGQVFYDPAKPDFS